MREAERKLIEAMTTYGLMLTGLFYVDQHGEIQEGFAYPTEISRARGHVNECAAALAELVA